MTLQPTTPQYTPISCTVKSDDHSPVFKSFVHSGQRLVAARILLQIMPHVREGPCRVILLVGPRGGVSSLVYVCTKHSLIWRCGLFCKALDSLSISSKSQRSIIFIVCLTVPTPGRCRNNLDQQSFHASFKLGHCWVRVASTC